jgi:hypothetical protein
MQVKVCFENSLKNANLVLLCLEKQIESWHACIEGEKSF